MEYGNEFMGGLPAFRSGEYTGRMGDNGEPERFEDVRGGDPRLQQQLDLERYQQRLAAPVTLSSWMTGANKDVRGLDPASQITLAPGTRYQIRDYTGDRSGEVIASGSTPEEFLRMQDIAQGLANQGRMADYRIEQVGGAPTGGLGQYTDPATGEAVTLLGGDLYNRPGTAVIGDIAKIAVPLALQFVPGLGTALGANLGLSGLGAKMAGIGLTSALGRTGAGLATGEKLGEALKAGAIGGLASGATAGLLGATGADKALANVLGGAKGALAGEGASQAVGQGVGQAAASVPGEIVVSASRLAPSILAGLGAAGGSLLGDVGNSLARPDQFQQALDQARLDNQFGAPPAAPVPGDSPMIDVSSTPTAPLSNAAAVAGGAAGGVQNIFGPQETGNLPTTEGELIDVTGNRYGAPSLGDYLAVPAAASVLPLATAGGPGVTAYSPPPSGDALQANAQNITSAPEMTVTASPIQSAGSLGAALPGLAMTLPAMTAGQAVSAGTGGGKTGTVGKVLGGLTALDALTSLLGISTGRGGAGDGFVPGAGAAALGTRASLDPAFSRQLPAARGIFSPQSFAPRDMSGVDFTRYGYGPAQSFFENVPRNPDEYKAASAPPAPPVGYMPPGNEVADYIRRMAPGVTDAQIAAYMQSPDAQQMAQYGNNVTGFAEGGMLAAKGGSPPRASRAVDGPGTGRSDEIPALLSDGEYVIDAETVAMLGDGSSKAGAKRLDELRVKVRKHKGRNLAKGEFSANAKRPENYLSGGRV